MSTTYRVQCDCQAVEVSMTGGPKVHGYCHCEDCRELLQVPYHSVLAWEDGNVEITRGQSEVIEFQHPTKRMKRVFCKHCGDVIYNTNAMGWKLVSQLLFRRCNNDTLPEGFASTSHFFYDRRIIDIADDLPKRG
ncbi:GFA family protein [Marinobacterium sp. AK62]|uniref:GFA family protein n=1 Tax=Marinobacterium alkalitolerans TaxID=1542925 RepID=A0ABS3ZDT9_9GAMM|nr:GFA family protein [Marinobacterium alkalitolerans]MBP0049868.1 GFA family protein [Marinobacterium alkalitolerans]